MSPDGLVKNLPQSKTPLMTKLRKVEPRLPSTDAPQSLKIQSSLSSMSIPFDLLSLGDFPDIHSSYHAKSRMPNVLTVKRLDRGRFVPVNKAAIKVREGTGTTGFSMGDRSVHF